MDLARKTVFDAALLQTLLRESRTEVLVFDAQTHRIEQANPAALTNLQTTLREVRKRPASDLFCDAHEFDALFALLKNGRKRRASLDVRCRRHDGSSYPAEVRLFSSTRNDTPVFIALIDDVSEREASRRALAHTESDLRAIMANIPGMAYQVFRPHDGPTRLRYVSDQSSKLLGIKAKSLREHPERFFELILPEDRPSYLAGLAKAGGSHMSFNWEGRVWVEAWKDVKWVNLRVGERKVADGTLWDGIMLNVTRSKETEAEMKQSRAQLAALTAHVETVKEQERVKLAREVHDDLGGNLTAIKIGLAWLLRHSPADLPHLHERVGYLDAIVDQTIEATHRIAANLRPSMLDFGIVSALKWQLEQFERNTGTAAEFAASHEDIPLDADRAIAVFRIVQEALTNVAKHARASRVSLRLERHADRLEVEITDNGAGFAPARPMAAWNGFGILGMTERAAALGGKVSLAPAAGGGTRVRLHLPLKAAARKIALPGRKR